MTSIWMSNRQFKLSMSKTQLLVFPPQNLLYLIFPISVKDNIIFPVAQNKTSSHPWLICFSDTYLIDQ